MSYTSDKGTKQYESKWSLSSFCVYTRRACSRRRNLPIICMWQQIKLFDILDLLEYRTSDCSFLIVMTIHMLSSLIISFIWNWLIKYFSRICISSQKCDLFDHRIVISTVSVVNITFSSSCANFCDPWLLLCLEFKLFYFVENVRDKPLCLKLEIY